MTIEEERLSIYIALQETAQCHDWVAIIVITDGCFIKLVLVLNSVIVCKEKYGKIVTLVS